MEFIIRNHKTPDLWFILMTIFNNSCIFYYIFLMPCCGILLRHFALYINLSQHRWADFFFLLWAADGAKPRSGLGSAQGCRQSVQAGSKSAGWTSIRDPASSKSCSPDCKSDAFPRPGSSFPTSPAKLRCRWGEKFNCRGLSSLLKDFLLGNAYLFRLLLKCVLLWRALPAFLGPLVQISCCILSAPSLLHPGYRSSSRRSHGEGELVSIVAAFWLCRKAAAPSLFHPSIPSSLPPSCLLQPAASQPCAAGYGEGREGAGGDGQQLGAEAS